MKAINTTITVLVVLVVGAGAFLGGTFYQKQKDSLEGLSGPELMEKVSQLDGELGDGLDSGRVLGDVAQGGQRPFPGGAPSTMNGRVAIGTITAKTDDAVTLELFTGETKTINITDSTTIQKQATGSITDLEVGNTITSTLASGTSDAVSIQLGGQNFPPNSR